MRLSLPLNARGDDSCGSYSPPAPPSVDTNRVARVRITPQCRSDCSRASYPPSWLGLLAYELPTITGGVVCVQNTAIGNTVARVRIDRWRRSGTRTRRRHRTTALSAAAEASLHFRARVHDAHVDGVDAIRDWRHKDSYIRTAPCSRQTICE